MSLKILSDGEPTKSRITRLLFPFGLAPRPVGLSRTRESQAAALGRCLCGPPPLHARGLGKDSPCSYAKILPQRLPKANCVLSATRNTPLPSASMCIWFIC